MGFSQAVHVMSSQDRSGGWVVDSIQHRLHLLQSQREDHPAVLAMIQMVADNIHAEGKWIGICGELGADLEMTEIFLKMGIDELSVSPSMILSVRKKVREIK